MTRPYTILPYYCRIAYAYLLFSFFISAICCDARINCIYYNYYLMPGLWVLSPIHVSPE